MRIGAGSPGDILVRLRSPKGETQLARGLLPRAIFGEAGDVREPEARSKVPGESAARRHQHARLLPQGHRKRTRAATSRRTKGARALSITRGRGSRSSATRSTVACARSSSAS
jgi:CRP-like cAMP-binding protein